MTLGAHHEYARRRVLVEAVALDELRRAPSALSARVEPVRAQLRTALASAPA
jgi:hypothetical protein